MKNLTLGITVFFYSMIIFFSACGSDDSDDSDSTTSASSELTIKGAIGSASQLRLATQGIDPGFVKMKLYKAGYSTSTDCSDMTVISVSETPEEKDWMQGPTLGSGTLANGTYKCVAMEISSMIKFSSSEGSDNGYCTKDKQINMDVCRDGATSTLLDGSETSCQSQTANRITVYMSTGGSQGEACGEGCGFKPGDPTYLVSSLVVDGAQTGTFKMNALGMVGEYDTGEQGTTECAMDEPSWSFE
jgi:hypothetical protein